MGDLINYTKSFSKLITPIKGYVTGIFGFIHDDRKNTNNAFVVFVDFNSIPTFDDVEPIIKNILGSIKNPDECYITGVQAHLYDNLLTRTLLMEDMDRDVVKIVNSQYEGILNSKK